MPVRPSRGIGTAPHLRTVGPLNRWFGMDKAADYRREAEEAELRAKECRDPEARRTYEQVARRWLEMAELAERLGGSVD